MKKIIPKTKKPLTVAIIGTGFVGVVSAAVYAALGNSVIGVDIDERKVSLLTKSKVPFYEPQLEELLIKTQKEGALSFTTDYSQAIPQADIIIVAVGTPSQKDGGADLQYVFAAIESLAPYIHNKAVVVIKSTVPPGTLPIIEQKLQKLTKTTFATASVPEFLREGSAVSDTLNPDRIVIGADVEYAYQLLEQLHAPLAAPIIRVAPESAQMAKYAANAYLATRITFINQVADLCEKNGADIQEVITAIGYDKRIGDHYWYPGLGYGGSCFPKDVKELSQYSKKVGEENNLFTKIHTLNEARIPRLLAQYGERIGGFAGKTVALLGLSFKPHTDDMREAPSVRVVPQLLEQNAVLRCFDPEAIPTAAHFLPQDKHLSYYSHLSECAEGADVIMALIEWPEITGFDYATVRDPSRTQYFIDARNQLDPQKITAAGFVYLGIGR